MTEVPAGGTQPVAGEYHAGAFWEERLRSRKGLEGVGHAGLGDAFNGWMYRARRTAVYRMLRRGGMDPRGRDVLDVGVGVGAWVPFWERLGAGSITGVDITAAGVEACSARYPAGRFTVCDVTEPDALAGRQFDIVTAFDVLYHVVEDARFGVALRNLAGAMKPDGAGLIIDGFGRRPWGPAYHEYHRSRAHYEAELGRAGLELVDVRPVFFTLETPVAASGGWAAPLERGVGLVHRRVNSAAARGFGFLGHVPGAVLWAVDTTLGAFATGGPGLKVALVRRSGRG